MARENNYEAFETSQPIDWLTAMLIFILPLVSIGLAQITLSQWLVGVLMLCFLGCLLTMLIWGVSRGLPRWSLAYVGLFLTGLVFYTQVWGILALLCGASLALWIIAIGKWFLVPMQDWPVDLEGERGFEAVSAIASWVAIVLALLAPSALELLPPLPEPVEEKATAPV